METILNWISTHQEMIYVVVLMIFVGIEVIGHVPSVLHTPLMSGANAIHGVVIIGAIIVMGKAEGDNYVALVLGFLILRKVNSGPDDAGTTPVVTMGATSSGPR